VVLIVLDDVGFGQLGAYGGPVDTPNLDRLAAGGLRYINFHTTGLDGATYAVLLSGRNHHAADFSRGGEAAIRTADSHGTIPQSAATLAAVLRLAGYNTFAAGKWPLVPAMETTAAGPFDRWPLGMGFERFYGFLGRETDQWHPTLTEDNHRIETPGTPGYHLAADLTDQVIAYLRDQRQTGSERPVFVYLAYSAAHAPLHAPAAWSDRYRHKFDAGWDQIRAETFERQKNVGLVPKNTHLTPRDPGVKAWVELTPEEKKLGARLQEVLAGTLSYTDFQIGRLLDALKDLGVIDNTLILVMSASGASAEGGPFGTTQAERSHNGLPMLLGEMLRDFDRLGQAATYPHYPAGWAAAGNTPFKGWKGSTHRGGTAVPLIVHWPRKIRDVGQVRSPYHHVVDVMPTLLDAIGISMPASVGGFGRLPLHGVSFAPTFADAHAGDRPAVQYYEVLGNRALWSRHKLAVASHLPGQDWSQDRWELYDLATDFAQTRELAEKQPDQLQYSIIHWWAEAGKYDVIPLDERRAEGVGGDLRHLSAANVNRVELHPGTAPVPTLAVPQLVDRSHTVFVEMRMPKTGAEGLLIAQGGQFGGWALFVKDRRLYYVHNFLDIEAFELVSDRELPAGLVRLRFEFNRTGQNVGTGVLFINRDKVGELKTIRTAPVGYGTVSGEGLQVGRAWGTPVSSHYQVPFAFGGELRKVTLDVKGQQDSLRQRSGRE
jgi:arylsulfatase